MGKAQSKRSVDITTEVNKDGTAVDEGTGKMGKIEDVDQLKPQLNGDTNHKDAEVTGEDKQVEKDKPENEKDTATEKNGQPETVENGGGDAIVAVVIAVDEKETDTAKQAENGNNDTENVNDTTATTLNESKEVVEAGEDVNAASTPITDSNKKPKKEKSKKRFLSFRSFSFSKKDKQKPAKKGSADESAANTTAVTNGECEKVPEETTEEAVPATEENAIAAIDEKSNETAQPTTNGVSDEKKSDEEKPTPVVAIVEEPAKSVTVVESKPLAEIKQVAEETVEEAIVAASKSVDEKINVVAKPEVNDEKDLQENVESSEIIEQFSEKAIVVDTISNNNDTSVGLGDCTNNNPPPPLPECPPPSQITVFAETAMSVDDTALLPAPEHPKSNPIIDTIVPSDSALVGNTKIELNSAVDLAEPQIIVETKETLPVVEVLTVPIVTVIAPKSDEIENFELIAKPEEIAETIAILDSVNESDAKCVDESVVTAAQSSVELIKDDVSADISSPLPQNSLESLPSPQSLSSIVTPPSEVEENTTTEIANDLENSLPPPPVDVIINDQSLIATEVPLENTVTEKTLSLEPTNGTVDLPPPPPIEAETINDTIEPLANGNGELKTNGNSENHGADVLTTNGGSHLNGSKAEVADISDKENGIGKENSITEKLNGEADHKTIEETVTSPDKLEKLAAANPPPSTEIVAAE